MIRDWLSSSPGIAALLVVLGGWLLAYLLRRLVTYGVRWINRVSLNWGLDDSSLLSPVFTQVMQSIVFFGVFILSLILGFHILDGIESSVWVNDLLPVVWQLLVVLGILATGHIIALIIQSMLSSVSGTAGLGPLPRAAYGVIMGIAVVTALKHAGLDVSFITQLLLVIIAVVFAGLALAFALGARTLVANLAAQGEIQRIQPGDRLLVDGIEGTVLEIHRTGVVLSSEQGLAHVPASKFAESTVIEIRSDTADDG